MKIGELYMKPQKKRYQLQPILPGFDSKQWSYKRDGVKRSFEYLTKKGFKQLQKAEEPKIIGYTRIGRFREKTDRELLIHKDLFDIYEKKRFFRHIKGYIQIGSNRYVAATKLSILPFLILLFLLGSIFTGVILKSGISDVSNNPWNPWRPIVDQGIYNERITQEAERNGQIKISGFTAWSIPRNQNKNLPIRLINPENNPCYFEFQIVLTDTDEVIFQSQMVPPGTELTSIDITHSLAAGTYPAKAIIHTYELDTGTPMNTGEIVFDINVS